MADSVKVDKVSSGTDPRREFVGHMVSEEYGPLTEDAAHVFDGYQGSFPEPEPEEEPAAAINQMSANNAVSEAIEGAESASGKDQEVETISEEVAIKDDELTVPENIAIDDVDAEDIAPTEELGQALEAEGVISETQKTKKAPGFSFYTWEDEPDFSISNAIHWNGEVNPMQK